jgi:hypothetical protein
MVVMEELSPMCEGRGCDRRVGLASSGDHTNGCDGRVGSNL